MPRVPPGGMSGVHARSCEFGPLRVRFDDSVLTPRPWTVVQSRRAATLLEELPPGPLLELHCGAGHIGQAAAAWSARPLLQLDDDPAAYRWARYNAAVNGVRATVRCMPVEDLRVDGCFAVVLADPPYVPSSEVGRFAADPEHAIDGGADGLDGIRICLPIAARATRRSGALVMQVRGPEQASLVGRVAAEAGLELDLLDTFTVAPDRAIVTFVRR
jgi:methylase of polypeptide subunit release factors